MTKLLIGNVRGPQGEKGDRGDQGPAGPAGPNTVPTDLAVAAALTSGGAAQAAATAAFASSVEVVNPAGLNRIKASLGEATVAPVTITGVLDSIGTGVGSDGLSDQIYPFDGAQQATYRRNSWIMQAAKTLATSFGGRVVSGWLGPAYTAGNNGGGWQAATASTTYPVTQVGTTGPYGSQPGAQRGGVNIPNGGWNEFANVIGTVVEVLWWGEDAGVGAPVDPTVTVDGAVKYTATATSLGGKLRRTIISGLSTGAHTVRVSNTTSGKSLWFNGIIGRDEAGVIVNRIGSPGATTMHAVDTNQGSIQLERMITSSVFPTVTHCLVIALGTNDRTQQVPLETYKANLLALAQPVIDGGGCVLLFGGPTPNYNPTGTLTEEDYDNACRELAQANPNIAFVSIRKFLRSRAFAVAQGLFAGTSSVHPSRLGHALYARVLVWILSQPVITLSDAAVSAPSSPNAPTIQSVTASTVQIAWPAVVGAQRYTVRWSVNGGADQSAETDATSLLVTALPPNTSVALRVAAKNLVGNSPSGTTVTTVTAPNPYAAWTDDFNTDGALGAPWVIEGTTGPAPVYTKASGRVRVSSLTGGSAIARRNGAGPAFDAQAVMGPVGQYHSFGIMLKGTDVNNGLFLFGYVSTTDFHWRLIKRTTSGGQSVLDTSTTAVSADGDTVSWSPRTSGTWDVKVNGTTVFTVSDTTFAAGEYVGVYSTSSANSPNAYYDSFAVTPA